MLTAPELVWRAAQKPEHKYREEEYEGICATCAAEIEAGILTGEINNKTFSNHAEYFKYGSHVCRACAWLYGMGKGNPGNIIAAGDEYCRPVISPDSATEERPAWLDLLERIRDSPPEKKSTPVAGVLTTDVKPRVWPRMRVASVRDFGLYVHAQEYDISEYRDLDMALLLDATRPIREALAKGYSKSRIYHGLLSDFQRAKKDMKGVMHLEMHLQDIRDWPEFVPALIASYATKEEKDEYAGTRDTGGSVGSGEARGQASEDHARLF